MHRECASQPLRCSVRVRISGQPPTELKNLYLKADARDPEIESSPYIRRVQCQSTVIVWERLSRLTMVGNGRSYAIVK